MSVQDPWKPFLEVMEAPWEKALQWKTANNGKIIGHLLPDVPEEILHAAGALPVAIEGAGVQVSRAQAHIPGYTCTHAMGALELGLKGDLKALDGMVIPYVCDTTRNLFHIWDACFPQIKNEFLRLPKRMNHAAAREYLRAEFGRLFQWAGQLTGLQAGSEELASSVKLYDKSRARLRHAYLKHQEQPSLWTAERVGLLIASALRAPREDHLAWMDSLPWDEKTSDGPGARIPVYVRGKVWDPPGILNLLDSLGMLVVRDEIVTGFRGIEFDAGSDGDPLDALVERHFSTLPYPGYHLDPNQAVTGFVERVRASGAQGVIFLNPKFCEAAGFDTPDFNKALTDAKIPSLILETSARGASPDQVRLRLEAFGEMISGDLP
ncbi:MAG: 2-hydroxyacyl-CoA dehydratase [Desulfomonile tiedjei]|uniref:2-hydroxyacyl-CoA dehydratase n=1 Tax=Desulfomonile tiedjei TaxID=2358 RepID=A0A9D6Z247_9BACT|nr:2-hydroxyacyl-CoA dehydratase [Desulfomonile tiedjei]